jgi:hypothetical protein
VSASVQRVITFRAGGGSARRLTLALGGLPVGLMLYDDLLRLEPRHPLAAGVLAQAVVLALPLTLNLITARRSYVGRALSLPDPAPYSRPASPGHLKDLQIAPQQDGSVSCSVGIMAHNEEANIGHTVRAGLAQETPLVRIEEVIVVASGCTDGTEGAVAVMAEHEPRVRLCVQIKREGKASAVNLFLTQATGPVVVLIGADVIPETVNDPNSFMGHAVHVLWRLHDCLARIRPKLGEVVAFRNVVSGIPTNTSVDEISIQALVFQLGYKLVCEPACIVYDKGHRTPSICSRRT